MGAPPPLRRRWRAAPAQFVGREPADREAHLGRAGGRSPGGVDRGERRPEPVGGVAQPVGDTRPRVRPPRRARVMVCRRFARRAPERLNAERSMTGLAPDRRRLEAERAQPLQALLRRLVDHRHPVVPPARSTNDAKTGHRSRSSPHRVAHGHGDRGRPARRPRTRPGRPGCTSACPRPAGRGAGRRARTAGPARAPWREGRPKARRRRSGAASRAAPAPRPSARRSPSPGSARCADRTGAPERSPNASQRLRAPATPARSGSSAGSWAGRESTGSRSTSRTVSRAAMAPPAARRPQAVQLQVLAERTP